MKSLCVASLKIAITAVAIRYVVWCKEKRKSQYEQNIHNEVRSGPRRSRKKLVRNAFEAKYNEMAHELGLR